MAIEYATEFQPYVDEIFAAVSKKSILTNDDFKFDGANTIKVYKVGTSEMNDYGRGGASGENWSRYGAVSDLDATTESMTITRDRSFTFVIDTLDGDETKERLEAASALARQLRQVVVPEVDSYVYGVMCADAGNKPAPIVLTASNVFDQIVEASKVLDDNEVPEDERFLVVTPSVFTIMKKSSDIVMNTDAGAAMRLKGVIAEIDGVTVIKVPEIRLPQGFGFLMGHKVATVAPTKLKDYVTHTNPPGINGSLVEGRIAYDAFVLDNKAVALYYLAQTEPEAAG